MSNIKINYIQFHNTDYNGSPFIRNEIGYDLESLYDYKIKNLNAEERNSNYYRCPSWKHKATRIFIVKSPIDITLHVDIDKQELHSPNLNQEQFDDYCTPTFMSDNWCKNDRVTIQLSVPRFIFWTNKRNIWIESRPFFKTSLQNNLTSIPGWFKISDWNRPIATSFDIVDLEKPVIIKRGDPLFEISFYSRNLDDGIILNRKKSIPDEIVNNVNKTLSVKKYFPKFIGKYLFKEEKEDEVKCPFNFLWKK
jgi:hypothetical protein